MTSVLVRAPPSQLRWSWGKIGMSFKEILQPIIRFQGWKVWIFCFFGFLFLPYFFGGATPKMVGFRNNRRGFPTKNYHFWGVKWGETHHLRKHPNMVSLWFSLHLPKESPFTMWWAKSRIIQVTVSFASFFRCLLRLQNQACLFAVLPVVFRAYISYESVLVVSKTLPASPFDAPNGGHLSPKKVTYGSKRGHFEEAGTYWQWCWIP